MNNRFKVPGECCESPPMRERLETALRRSETTLPYNTEL